MWSGLSLLAITSFPLFASTGARAEPSRQDSIASCVFPAGIDTTGWQTYRWYSEPDGRRLAVRLPRSFHEDQRRYGGKVWADGKRTLLHFNAHDPQCFWWNQDRHRWEEKPDCSDTKCVLSVIPYNVETWYEVRDTAFVLTATREKVGTQGDSDQLRGTSPDSSDLGLFQAIVGSLQEESRRSSRGLLYMGGNPISGPYTLSYLNYRLTINRYQLPDVRPHQARLDPTGELESRRAVVAELVSYRDSLESAGVDWRTTVGLVQARALASGVDSVDVHDWGGSGNPELRITWPWGWNFEEIAKDSNFRMGTKGSYDENDKAITARLEHIGRLLDEGNAIFLLGGGSEFVVPSKEVKQVGSDILRKGNSKLLPQDVRDQLRSPLKLEQVQ